VTKYLRFAVMMTWASSFGLCPITAWAQLGDKTSTIDQLASKTKLSVKPVVTQKNYTIHELSDGVLTIKEYANKDGRIFAITWDGLSHPDLALLLGSYFEDFSQSVTHGGRPYGRTSQSEVRGEHVSVLKWGQMRSAHGKAYLHDELPQGLTIENIE
jgi:Protein of unknown function (DUF2844)